MLKNKIVFIFNIKLLIFYVYIIFVYLLYIYIEIRGSQCLEIYVIGDFLYKLQYKYLPVYYILPWIVVNTGYKVCYVSYYILIAACFLDYE